MGVVHALGEIHITVHVHYAKAHYLMREREGGRGGVALEFCFFVFSRVGKRGYGVE
jgi:hypothetical protein